MSNKRTWAQWFSGSPAPPPDELPTRVSPPPPNTTLKEVVVIPNTTVAGTAAGTATAPQLPPSTVGANALKAGIPPQPITLTARRGEYVALGGSRKSGKGRKGRKGKGKKSRKGKGKGKASKCRK